VPKWIKSLQEEAVVPEPLVELFSSRVRAVVLALMLPRPHLSFSLTDLSRRLGLPVSSLQHECYKLARLGLLRAQRAGNQRLYQPDSAWPLLEPVTALTVRAIPLEQALQGAIEGVPELDAAWVAGDVNAKTENVYLVLIGRLAIEEIDGIVDRARVALVPIVGSARCELAFFPPDEWRARLDNGEPFAASLLATPRLELHVPPDVTSAEVQVLDRSLHLSR
jgi:hypothetical protein